MKMLGKLSLSALALAATLAALGALAPGVAHAQRKIVIDPGHGGSDPGGVGNNLQEKNIVLDVSQRFKSLLAADTADTGGGGSWTPLLTRSSDVFVSLANRASYSNSNGADRFMSIHSNAFSSASANGTETFSYAEGSTGAALRNLVQSEMISAWGLTNRGNKTANFAVLRDTACPAVLHELAFITNTTDAAKLASATERQKAAVAHLRAIQRHYGLAPYIPGAAAPPPSQLGEVVGRVVDEYGPVANALVRLDTGAELVTLADGVFAFSDVAAGTRVLTASAEDHDENTVGVALAASGLAEIEIELVMHPGEVGGPGADPGETDEGDGDGTGAGTGGGGGDKGDDPGAGNGNADVELGGCSTGGGAAGGSALALIALGLVTGRMRRRRAS